MWEEVRFDIDVSIIKARLKPQAVKGRRKRRPKRVGLPSGPPRRSPRLGRASERGDSNSTQRTNPETATDDSGDTFCYGENVPINSDFLDEEVIIQEEATVQEANNDGSEKYYHVNYYFTMEFDGLLAKYTFWCEDAQYSQKGSVSLPDRYDFGVQ